MSFGDLEPGAVSPQTVLSVTAPAVGGTYAIHLDVRTWSFLGASGTTMSAAAIVALPPAAPLSPANGATGVSTTPTLTWTAVSGATSYEFYLGTSMPPPFVATTTANSYSPGALSPATQYFWRVVAKNSGGPSSSLTWGFATQAPGPGQPAYVIITMAGNGTQGYSGDGGPATSAQLLSPQAVAVDGTGNLYISDASGGVIRKVTTDGIITTAAGGGQGDVAPGGSPATSLALQYPEAIAVDPHGNLYIADTVHNRVLKVTPDGIATTVAGNGDSGNAGDGGPATSAELWYPMGVAVDAAGDVWISSFNSIRKVTPDGIIHTAGGQENSGDSGDGCPTTDALLFRPRGLAVDGVGNLYLSDIGSGRICKLALDGTVSTLAGDGMRDPGAPSCPGADSHFTPGGLALDGHGNIFFADGANCVIREVSPGGVVTTVAGVGTIGYSGDGGLASGAQFWYPAGVAVNAAGDIFVADGPNSVVRELLPADPSCQYRLDRTVIPVPGAGAVILISIQTGPSCWWAVANRPDWIASQAYGKGPATVNLTVSANSAALRTATISIAGTAVSVTQGDSACRYSVGSGVASFTAADSAGSTAVTADPSCPWSADASLGWLTFTGPTFGIGSGTLTYAVAPNTGGPRSATVTIGGLPFTIEQSGHSATGPALVPAAPCRIASHGAKRPLGGSAPQGGCESPRLPGVGR
jgi:sugar lactone lactonase YvrE